MKRRVLILILVLAAPFIARAQNLMIGEKTPEIRVSQWIDEKSPASGNRPVLLDFFYPSNDQCIRSLETLSDLQNQHGNEIDIIVIHRESSDKTDPLFKGKNYGFYVGTDTNGRTFEAYGVRYVPFTVLIDGRGRLVWTGNVSNLTEEIIRRAKR